MKKFDYYIIKQFLSTFGLSISLILAIAVVFDFSEKIDNFLEHKAPTSLIIKDYYANFVIHYGVVFSGLITFVSVIFFTSKLSENNEIIALYNNKISPVRILTPYILGSFIIFIPNLYFQNYFLPSKNEARLNFENKYIKNKDVLREKKLHKQIDKNSFIFIKNYDVKNNKGYSVDIQKFDQNQLIEKTTGTTITWNSEKNIWELKNYKKQLFSKNNIQTIFKDNMDIDFNMKPSELFQQNRSVKSMNTSELNKFISTEKYRGSDLLPIYQIEQHERFSYSFSIFIFTLLGFLIANKKNRGGLGYKLSIGLGVCFFYIFLMKFAITFSINSSAPAFVTVWTPNIICLLFCMLFFKKLT